MRNITDDKIYTVEEYIQHEWTAERRSEFINGQLFEMPGEKDVNNVMAGLVYILFMNFLEVRDFSCIAMM